MGYQIYDAIVLGSDLNAFVASNELKKDKLDVLHISERTKNEIFSSIDFIKNRKFFFLNRDVHTWELVRGCELLDEVKTMSFKEFLPKVLFDNRLHVIPTNLKELIFSKIFSNKGKFQLIKDYFFPKSIKREQSLKEILIERLSECDAEMASNIIASKLRGGLPELIDLYAMYPELSQDFYRTESLLAFFGTKVKGQSGPFQKICYIAGGEIKLTSKLVSKIGVNAIFGEKIISITRHGNLYQVITSRNKYITRNLVVSGKAHQIGDLLADVDIDLSDLLKSLPYASAIEVDYEFNASDIDVYEKGFGIISIDDAHSRVREISFSRSERKNIQLMCLLDGDDGNLWNRADEQIIKIVKDDIRELLGISGDTIVSSVVRHNEFSYMYHLGHDSTLATFNKYLEKHNGISMIGKFLKGIRLENILKSRVNVKVDDTPNIVVDDPYLKPQIDHIIKRRDLIALKEAELLGGYKSLFDFASGHKYFGMHKHDNKLVVREWAPNATAMYLICDKNNWKKRDDYRFTLKDHGVWEIELDHDHLKHLDLYKLFIEWNGGAGERIPSYANYVVQDENTHLFSACVWMPEKEFSFQHKLLRQIDAPIIYECHVGMSSEEGKVNSYIDFTENVLPNIVSAGYNTVQIMAIQEHPYYGSFGYQVSNFFAPSSRSGTPDDLKRLIDTAHQMGVRVIMDIVHSHAVKNENEGLGRFDGTQFQYFHDGDKGLHPAWDTYCFNYGKNEVLHFLLSNVRYWMEEFKFDGFRFDGVTSMLYHHHGLGKAFTSYDDYFGSDTDYDAVTYLGLANKLMKEINPRSISIAEDMSGMPGIAAPIADGGIGFDYRLAMGIPDVWIKIIKERKDEDWSMREIWNTLMDVRYHEGSISYVESHDQALVGDKTTIFRLIDKDMYTNMSVSNRNHVVDRGIAIQKLIRLITFITAKNGYLNFMGNEFGHPEWIDFPREGNNWSYHYARRQWSLRDNQDLCYKFLSSFDKAMLELFNQHDHFRHDWAHEFWIHDGDKVIAIKRGKLIFVFNFDPSNSYREYMIPAEAGKYSLIMHSDQSIFGGYDNLPDIGYKCSTFEGKLSFYLPARTVQVFIKE